MKWWIGGAVLVCALIAALLIYKEPYHVDVEGRIHAPDVDLQSTKALFRENDTLTIYRITYHSYGKTIYGDLYVPVNATSKGMLLLPGGGVGKKEEAPTAERFALWGYTVLTIDQRGVGETGGSVYGLEQDFAVFEQGQIPTNHLFILDALAGVQFLKEQRTKNIIIAGESMGGRIAIVAASISDDVAGVLVVSSAGFGDPFLPTQQRRFLRTFDPDANVQYVDVPIIFIHSANDTIIPVANAQATFDRANNPKKMFIIDNCPHGYCTAMEEPISEGMKMFD
jgi:pimeloyl-ACP methyl ester carboxylesterase